MIVANSLTSLDFNNNVFEQDIYYYFSAVYVVSYIDGENLSYKYYNSTPCENVFPNQNDTRLLYL